MRAAAFCPAHITGFFKASLDGGRGPAENCGSVGAGFSIREGVTTRVEVRPRRPRESQFRISLRGYGADGTAVSEAVLNDFVGMGGFDGLFFDIVHEIAVPVGFGLGSSGAAALSLAYALDGALGTGLGCEAAGRIAHNAEVGCGTGLGDVLASYYGGFEVRTRPGAPGIGRVERMAAGPASVVVLCLSPVSTSGFIGSRLHEINGAGGRMAGRLLETGDYGHFQEMSLEFARHAGVMTPRMEEVAGRLASAGIGCGVALFGETVFSIVPAGAEAAALDVMGEYPGGLVIRSELDGLGARMLCN